MLSPSHGPIAYVSRVSAPKTPVEERKRRGIRLRAWRKLRGLTQAEAAAAAGVEQPNWSGYESGARWMHGDTLSGVLDALRITNEQLVGEGPIEDDPPESEPVRLDPKERVRRSWRYEDAPVDARDAWEEWDEQNATADKSKLDEDFYDRLLQGFVLQERAGALPKRGLLPGAQLAEPIDDPDAPRKG